MEPQSLVNRHLKMWKFQPESLKVTLVSGIGYLATWENGPSDANLIKQVSQMLPVYLAAFWWIGNVSAQPLSFSGIVVDFSSATFCIFQFSFFLTAYIAASLNWLSRHLFQVMHVSRILLSSSYFCSCVVRSIEWGLLKYFLLEVLADQQE